MYPLLYFIIPLTLLFITYILNLHFKWLTKQNFYKTICNNQSNDPFFFGLSILLCIVAWPIFLLLITIVGTIIIIPKIIHSIIPNDNNENVEDNNLNSP